MDPQDADFSAKSWRKMLSDLDLEPFTAASPSSAQVTPASALLRFTVASVSRENYVKKVTFRHGFCSLLFPVRRTLFSRLDVPQLCLRFLT